MFFHVCIFFILGLKVWIFICLPGEISDLMLFHLQHRILGKLTSLTVCIWSRFHPQRNILFESISRLLCLIIWIDAVDHLKRTTSPGFADISHRKRRHHFKSTPLSALYIDVFIFGKKRKTVYHWDDVERTWAQSCITEGSWWYLFSLFSTRCAH